MVVDRRLDPQFKLLDGKLHRATFRLSEVDNFHTNESLPRNFTKRIPSFQNDDSFLYWHAPYEHLLTLQKAFMSSFPAKKHSQCGSEGEGREKSSSHNVIMIHSDSVNPKESIGKSELIIQKFCETEVFG